MGDNNVAPIRLKTNTRLPLAPLHPNNFWSPSFTWKLSPAQHVKAINVCSPILTPCLSLHAVTTCVGPRWPCDRQHDERTGASLLHLGHHRWQHQHHCRHRHHCGGGHAKLLLLQTLGFPIGRVLELPLSCLPSVESWALLAQGFC